MLAKRYYRFMDTHAPWRLRNRMEEERLRFGIDIGRLEKYCADQIADAQGPITRLIRKYLKGTAKVNFDPDNRQHILTVRVALSDQAVYAMQNRDVWKDIIEYHMRDITEQLKRIYTP